MDITLSKVNGDINISNGDFVINDTTNQEIADILSYANGELKQFPSVGVYLEGYEKGEINGLQNVIKKQLINDGIKVNLLNVNLDASGKLQVQVNGTR